jgi:hypothetical protein
MGNYVALQRLSLGGVDYKGGDILPSDAIDPQRVGGAIYAGVLVYAPDAGEVYQGPWPGEHHHNSTEMQAIVDAAIAGTFVAPAAKAKPASKPVEKPAVVEEVVEEAPVEKPVAKKAPAKKAASSKQS